MLERRVLVTTLLIASGIGAPMSAAQSQSPSTARSTPLAITNVTVHPMDREEVLRDQTVVVVDGRIAAMGASSSVRPPAGATVVDGRGKFLIPGLAEMHAHVPAGNAPREVTERALTLYALSGVTTARGMLGDPAHLELRRTIAAGTTFGPRLLTSGPSLNGNSAPTVQAGVRAVEAQKAAGYDLLKIHPGISREVFDSIAATAQRVGIPFAGHVPLAVGWQRALETRFQTVDHVDGLLEAMLPSNAPLTTAQGGFFGLALVDHLDLSRLPALVAATKAAGVAMVPTQSLMESYVDDTPPAVLAARPEMRYWLPNQVQAWTMNKTNLLASGQFSLEQRTRFLELRREVVKALHDGGVVFLLGSDAPQVWNVPGFSAHRELEALVLAGLTPYQAIRSGTMNVAEFYNETEVAGSVRTGKRADLLLLDADPMSNIANTQRIAGVVVAGRWISADERARRLEALSTP